jgi:hypothetical protein
MMSAKAIDLGPTPEIWASLGFLTLRTGCAILQGLSVIDAGGDSACELISKNILFSPARPQVSLQCTPNNARTIIKQYGGTMGKLATESDTAGDGFPVCGIGP